MRGKTGFVALVLAVLVAGPVAGAQEEEKPKPDIEFSVAGDTFTSKENVKMTGTIDPFTAGEDVLIKVQKYNKDQEVWKFFDKNTVQADDQGAFQFKHEPLPKGTYRARAEVQETDDHLAGKNKWKRYKVVPKRNNQ